MQLTPVLGIILSFIKLIDCDVSHLAHGLIHQIHQLYGPPPIIATTSAPFLPEIIINRKINHQGYDYNHPENNYLPPPPPIQDVDPPQPFPPQQDEPQVPPPPQGYLPPSIKNSDLVVSYDGIGYDYNVPPSISVPQPAPGADAPYEPEIPEHPELGYNYEVPPAQQPPTLPEPTQPPQPGYLPPPSVLAIPRNHKDFDQFSVRAKNPIKLQLREMRCLNNQGGYFKTVLRVESFLGAIPIVDNDSIDSRCDLRLIQSHIIIAISSEDFQRCGVRRCAENLCLRIRFPLIRGMKTGSDSLLTLQCKVQDRIVAKTHSLKMGISNDIQGKSLGAYAQGGTQQPLRTHIELLKKSLNGFTKHVDPSAAVQLGEELLLRAHVLAGDGWNFTKLTDVNLQRISPSGDIINSANLVTSSGCVNPTMRTICPAAPSFEPPLGHRLSFKAVMFQGMRSGDEIIMNMKISGCIERGDCYVSSNACGSHLRTRRNSKENRTMSEFSEVSEISFRVQLPEEDSKNEDSRFKKDGASLLIVGTLGLVCIILGIMILIYFKFK